MAMIIENQGKLPDENILNRIPGIVFVSPGKAPGIEQGFAREVLFMDQLTGYLQKESGDNLAPGNLEPSGQLAQVIYNPVSPGELKKVTLEHQQVNALLFDLEKRFYEKSGLEGKVDLAISCLVGPSLYLAPQVISPLVRGGSVYILPPDISVQDIHLLEYYTDKNENKKDVPGKARHIRLITTTADKEIVVEDGHVAPQDQLEETLAEIWSGLLGVEKTALGVEDNFFERGGHSLKATTLIAKIHQRFGVKIKLLDLFTDPTIKEIARMIKKESGTMEETIMPAEEKEYYPLSSAQKRLYLVQQIEAQTTNYNMFDALELEGALDKEKFERTFRQLIRRQASFRTSFITVEEVPVQRIHPEVEFEIEYYDASQVEVKVEVEEERASRLEGTRGLAPLPVELATGTIKNFIRPFDLSQAPLLRVGLIELSPERQILMVDMNHIISDGTSIGIFIKEFIALYRENPLPPLNLQYKDYSQWQNSSRYWESLENQEKYWLNQYQGEIPQLKLPLDFPRPSIQGFAGDEVRFELDEEITAQLHQLALAGEATLYMLLLAIYSILLSKLSRQEDIIIGTPIAGRKYDALQSIMGMFVNTLAMRNFPVKTKTFKEFLTEVKERTLQAFENQDYPFEELVDRTAASRDSSRNPLFDVMFAFQNLDIPEAQIPGLKLKPFPHHMHTSPFELILNAEEKDGKLLFKFWFCTALFRKDKIQRFILYFKEIISHVIENKAVQLVDIKVSHELKEKKLIIPQQVREGFNF
jgi:acyl carrier protein